MSDLISRQDAIEAIKKRDPGCGEDACYIIEQLPSAQPERKKGKWISCSERLPDEDRAFLVTNSQWGYPLLEITYWLTDGWQTKGKPIAWMPLPKAYEGKTK